MYREISEISCLACGRALGKVEQAEGRTRLLPADESPNAAPLLRKRGVGLVCGRCGGRALVGAAERVIRYAA